jgi:CubicO group peptidase (beta-lactamase class C family)
MSAGTPVRPMQAFSRRATMLAALAACVLSTMAGGAAPGAAARAADIDAIVASAAAGYLAHPARRLSIGVLRQGERHSYHFGVLDKNSGSRRATRPSTDRLGLENFVGGLLAQAAIEHKLKLDDDVRLYLDGDYPNLAVDGQPVRLYHLLNHRSGLPFILPNPPEAAPDFPDPRPFPQRIDEIVARSSRVDFDANLHKVTLKAAPGASFQYSNAAAQLAGYVLERVYGQPLETLLREKITAPRQMNDTVIALQPAQQPRVAPGYDEQGQVQRPASDNFQGAGSIKSTLPDMLNYAAWQLDRNDAVIKLSHSPTYTDEAFSIGLNWQMLREQEREVIWQDGAMPGYASFCILQPQLDMALVILSNELDPATLGRLSTLANRVMHGIDARSVIKP